MDKKYDANGEECPMGDACSIHFRNDEEMLSEEFEAGRLITYLGDYVIITDDNPDLFSPAIMLRMLLAPDGDMPPRYETAIIRVGEGALGDLRELPVEQAEAQVLFTQQHDEWENFRSAHDMVVEGVKTDMIAL